MSWIVQNGFYRPFELLSFVQWMLKLKLSPKDILIKADCLRLLSGDCHDHIIFYLPDGLLSRIRFIVW